MRTMIRVAAMMVLGAGLLPSAAAAEEGTPAALAQAMSAAKATLEAGLKASEREGRPISAKFEIEDGRLQLSVYTAKDQAFTEVVLDPATATIVKTEKITGGDDLQEAGEQSGAMATAQVSLVAATEAAIKATAGLRAVSVVPDLNNGRSVAVVTLLQGTNFKQVTTPLD